DVAFADGGALAVVAPDEIPTDLRMDLRVDVAVEGRDPFARRRDALFRHRRDQYFKRRRCRRHRRASHLAGGEPQQGNDRQAAAKSLSYTNPHERSFSTTSLMANSTRARH